MSSFEDFNSPSIWKQFLERKKESMEDKEERLHKDLDGDDEEGESEEHKKKVFGFKKGKKKESMEDKEERLHKDLDGDNEEGESEEHKKKVFGFKKKK